MASKTTSEIKEVGKIQYSFLIFVKFVADNYGSFVQLNKENVYKVFMTVFTSDDPVELMKKAFKFVKADVEKKYKEDCMDVTISKYLNVRVYSDLNNPDIASAEQQKLEFVIDPRHNRNIDIDMTMEPYDYVWTNRICIKTKKLHNRVQSFAGFLEKEHKDIPCARPSLKTHARSSSMSQKEKPYDEIITGRSVMQSPLPPPPFALTPPNLQMLKDKRLLEILQKPTFNRFIS
ncbi:MAG: hypothetical protein Edafosvirus6_26 [Edafosvirus sp.]|uniref:Uncharacterized protein n=1 Tax=Edafosvirus sp. TaxID=2487765 RepID=A0A3G4ZTG9_9VIRU|nr:MAG: hypothetical protein Edafosvirus6_26 [Edafosvirus sp.]